MTNTIEDIINEQINDQVDQVIDDKIEDHHRIEDLDSRVASLEDRVEELLQALRDKGGNPTLAKEIENL
jgi:predicted ArsR family transcriptional regulator|tara:strand:- start:293 stop:499 length:207 start_codon:yes stop_codon:yes gene_type:complete